MDADKSAYIEEEVRVQSSEITLAGTLTIPSTSGPHPAVLMIPGAAPFDRDCTIGELKPFRVIADSLATNGIAVLRLDDRGIGGSGGEHKHQYTFDVFADDVLAAVAFLRARSDIDATQVGLFGWSMGGVIAPLVASRSPDVAFVILMAGYSLPGEELMMKNRPIWERAQGRTEDEIEAMLNIQRRVIRAARENQEWNAIKDELCERARIDFDNLPEDQKSQFNTFDDYFRSTYDVSWGSYLFTPVAQSFFLDHDPSLSLRQVRCPVLALFGENDLSVPSEGNREAMVRALEEGECTDYQVKVLPGANHAFYGSEVPGGEFVPGFLDSITGWLLERVQLQ